MANSPAHNIALLLISNNLGVAASAALLPWTVRVGRLADRPDAQIATFDSGGQPDNPKWRINYPSVQVRVRGPKDDYVGGHAKANNVNEFLNGIEPRALADGNWLSGMIMIGGITHIGYDSESRPEWTINYRLFLEPAALSSPQMHRESL